MEKRTFSKTFSLTFQEWDQIKEIMEKHGSLSPSETIRNLVRIAHQKEFPDYIYNRSATDVAKRATLEKNNDLEELTDLQYARKYLPGGVFYEGENPQTHEIDQVYLIFDEQGRIRPWHLKNIKKYYTNQKNHVNAHKEAVKTRNISNELDERMCKDLNVMWEVDIPEHFEEEL